MRVRFDLAPFDSHVELLAAHLNREELSEHIPSVLGPSSAVENDGCPLLRCVVRDGYRIAEETSSAATQINADSLTYVERDAFVAFFTPTVSHAVLAGGLQRGFENLFRTFVAYHWMPKRGLMFHAATLRFGDDVVMYAGSPGAGKSTISDEGGADSVLTNELSILDRRSDGWWAMPSPFWGHGDVAQPSVEGRLRAICILSHGTASNAWTPLSGADALQALMPHLGALTPAQSTDRGTFDRMVSIIADVPVYSFAWARTRPPLEDAPWLT